MRQLGGGGVQSQRRDCSEYFRDSVETPEKPKFRSKDQVIEQACPAYGPQISESKKEKIEKIIKKLRYLWNNILAVTQNTCPEREEKVKWRKNIFKRRERNFLNW